MKFHKRMVFSYLYLIHLVTFNGVGVAFSWLMPPFENGLFQSIVCATRQDGDRQMGHASSLIAQ